jgi:hypothetical protein
LHYPFAVQIQANIGFPNRGIVFIACWRYSRKIIIVTGCMEA